MPVLIEGISVVVQAAAILSSYHGGWDAFASAAPNETLCADGELARVGFMVPDDARAFATTLEAGGLVSLSAGRARDLVLVDQLRRLSAPCDWAEVGTVPWEGDARQVVGCCRLAGSTSVEVVVPPGWTYASSLTAHQVLVPEGSLPEFLDHLRSEDGVEVYRDLRTGQEVYVGRTKARRTEVP